MSLFAAINVGVTLSAGVFGLTIFAAVSMFRPVTYAAKTSDNAYEPEYPWCDFVDPAENAVGMKETVRISVATVRAA